MPVFRHIVVVVSMMSILNVPAPSLAADLSRPILTNEKNDGKATTARLHTRIIERVADVPIVDAGFISGDESFFFVAENGQITYKSDDGLRRTNSISLGEDDYIEHVHFLPVKEEILYFSKDGHVGKWSLEPEETPEWLFELKGDGIINAVEASPDGSSIVLSYESGHAKIIDLNDTSRIVQTFTSNTEPLIVSRFMPGSMLVLSVSWLGNAYLWDTRTGKAVANFSASGEVLNVDVSPNGERILLTTLEGEVFVWLVDAPEAPFALLKTKSISDAAGKFGLNENKILFARDNVLEQFDLTNSNGKSTTLSGHAKNQSIVDITVAEDRRFVATASLDGTAQLWNAATQRMVANFEGHDSDLQRVILDHDADRAFTLAHDGSLVLWKLE
jgi:WD40 repeat protein